VVIFGPIESLNRFITMIERERTPPTAPAPDLASGALSPRAGGGHG
jgi:hypothetical protein